MTTAKRKLSEFGGASNGGGIEGVLKAAIDGVDEGGTLVFDAFRFEGNLTSSFEYAVFSPVIINKSILIEGETSDIRLVNKTAESPTFIVQPNKNQFFFGVENIKFISGSRAIEITGTNTLSPNSRIYNVSFISQSISSVRITTPEANLHLENVHIQGSPQYGLSVENSKNHLNLSIDKCKIENTTVAAIYINNTDLNSGSVYINDSELNDNNQAIVVNNVRYYEHNIEYFQNQANYILSGSSIRLTGSAGGGGGGGVTDHGLLTGLADDDHKQYLPISGTRGMSGSLNMNGHDITNVGNVDGVDVSTLDATLDAHILDVNNPHSTKFSNLVPETLANLNSAISDDDVLGVSIFRPFTASIQSATASIQASTASLQSSTASLQSFTASILPASASWESRLLILTNASATFRTELDTLFNVSASFRGELNSLKAATASLQSASSSLQSSTASLQVVSASLLAASSTFRTELTALTASIDKLNSASSSVEARFVTLFNASGSFRAELNSQTASINLLTAFSNSHASRHLSGGLDPIDAQSLRANGIAANRVLISDGLGGWTTVLSSAFGGGAGGSHASSHLSGGSDPIDAHLLRANGIGINRVLIADGIGGWITVLSSAIGVYDHGLLTGLTDDDHPQYTLRTDFNPFTASIQSATASIQASTASLQTVSASLLAVSSSYNTLSASYTSFSASLNSASASWESRLLILANASATFRTELNALTTSVVRLDSASGTFESRLISQTASINLLTAFSNSHASRHLSGAADPIDIQLLRANSQPVGTIFAANSVGGISTIHSGVFLLTSSYQNFSASYQTFTASIQSATASLQASTASLQTVSASLLAMSSSYNVLSSTYYPVSSSFNTVSASYVAFSASLNSASASWESRLSTLTNASATFRSELNSQTASINLLTAFSNSHASRHLSGAADPIDAQLLRGNGVAPNRLLISDGLGGWTTVISTSVGTPPGAPANHASTHLSGGSDQVNAQDLGANGLTANQIMITNANGGWTTILSNSVGRDYDSFTASVQSATASIQASTASLQVVSASLLAMSSSYNILSSTYYPVSASYNTVSASYIAFSASLNSASASWESRLLILTNASATFRTELNALTTSVVRLDSASGTFESRLISQTASINLLTAFSNSHASRHLSGAADPIDIQLLRANAQPVGTIFAANSVGGISTIHSGVFLLTSSYQGFTASYQTFTSSVQSSTASLQASTASLQTFSSSLLAVSSSYNTVSASYIAFSASLNSASASWESRITTLINASATFRTELNSLTNSVVRLDSASGTFESRLISQTASINLLTAFSNSHAARHLSGAADPIDIQLLRANAQPVGTIFAANSVGGISTIHSGVFLLTSSYQGFTASYQTFTASIQSSTASIQASTASLQSATASLQTVSASLLAMSSSYNTLSATYYPVSASYNTLSASYVSFSASLNSASASWESRLLILTNASATFRSELNSQTASINLLTAFSNSHAARHLSGGLDPIDAQLLRANGIAINRVLISDGLGGWTTVLSSAFGGGGGGGGPHASTHLSGGSDQLSAQDLAANGLSSNQMMITNASGGWTTISSGVLKSPVCLAEGFSTSSYYQVSNLTQSTDFSIAVFARQYEWDSSQTQRALMSNLVNEFIGPGFALMSDSIRPKAKITDGFGTVYDNFVGDGWNHGSNGQLFILHFVKSGSIRSVYLNGESVYEGDMGTTTYGSGTQPMWLGAATGTWGQGWNGSIGGWAYKKNYLSASQIRQSARLIMEFSRINEGTTEFEHVWSLDGQSSIPTLLTDIGTSGSAHASLTGSLTLDCSIIKSFLSSIKSFSDVPNAHGSLHASGTSDAINAQDLGASGVAPNQLLISNMSGGWTTIASSSVGGAGGGITNILSATNEGRTLISGVFGNTAYLKTIKSLTSSVEGTQLSDTSPIILSSTNDIIYFKRRPTSLSQYFFDDFIGAVVTAAGFAWTFAAGGTGGGIAVQDIDATIFTDTYGTAIGAVYIDTGTTAAGGCILRQNPTAFSMRQMTGSSIEWRAAITGAYQAGTNEFRINLGWCNNITTASRRPTNGIFFEHTGTNAGFWNIVAVSSSNATVYNTGVPIKTTGSYQSFKIETTQSPLNTFTSTFYIDNVVVGMISTSIPNRRNQSVGPTAMISKEIGTSERGLIIDWCELFYEIYREPV